MANDKIKRPDKCYSCRYKDKYPVGCQTAGMQEPDALCFRYPNGCNRTTLHWTSDDPATVPVIRRCSLKCNHSGGHSAEYRIWSGTKTYEWEDKPIPQGDEDVETEEDDS